MPQGRKKVPFSGKAKKEQLKAKKYSKSKIYSGQKVLIVHSSDDEDDEKGVSVKKINEQPGYKGNRSKANRYALQFFNESNEEIFMKKEEAKKEIIPVTLKELEVSGDDYFSKDLDFPKRPEWSYDMSREELEARENLYFTEYVNNIQKKFNVKELSYFELNLETWRQLWRVIEMSDIVLFIVDIRYPALMFPPYLYDYITNDLKKDMILVLNKIDLAPSALVLAWKHYFTEKYPKLNVTMFTSTPGYNLRNNVDNSSGLQIRKRKGRLHMAAEGCQLLLDTCKSIVNNEVDLSSWQEKINEEMNMKSDEDDTVKIGKVLNFDKSDTSFYQHEKYKNGVLTIGCLGQPNVGKSSVMNAIMGKKVVSVSRTPGHTKHFQTIFLTQNIRLCDCPGLVFPSKVPKALQVLMGSYPIAQLRDPYTPIRYIAERLNLPELLKMKHPTEDDSWSVIDICDGWAKKRSFFTAKAARLDTYRAANNLLRMCLNGKICLCLYPPGYIEKQDYWQNHSDIKTVKWIQSFTNSDTEKCQSYVSDIDDSEDDDSENISEQISERQLSNSSQDDSDTCPIKIQPNKFMLLTND